MDAQVLSWSPQIQLSFAEIQHVRRFALTRVALACLTVVRLLSSAVV